jgi:uncharacterized protein YndB with AHSA1/START domain
MSDLAQHSGQRAVVSRPSDREIRMERTFNAPRERVWRAFTDPALTAQWWGRGNPVDIERMEVTRGGRWRFVEHGEEGTQTFEGRYREVTPMERLVYTFEWDGMPGHVLVDSVRFVDLEGGRTKVVTDSIFHTAEECEGMIQLGREQGLNESYAALDRLLAGLG